MKEMLLQKISAMARFITETTWHFVEAIVRIPQPVERVE